MEKPSKSYSGYIGLLVIIMVAFYMAGVFKLPGENEPHAEREVNYLIKRYHAAKGKEDEVDMCVQARLVKAAYLQINDAPHYQMWNKIEADDCKKAEIPAH